MRRFLFLGLFAFLALLALTLLLRDDGSLGAQPSAGGQALSNAPGVDRLVESLEGPAQRNAVATGEQEQGSEAAPAEALVTLSGTWTLLDRDVRALAPQDGWFVLRFYEERDDAVVGVKAGVWSVELPADSRFDVLEVELGGRRTDPIGEVEGLEIPSEARFDFSARWIDPVVLTVVDARTSAGLSDLTIIIDESSDPLALHPGSILPESVIVNGARSPVELPIPETAPDSETLWVRAPGYGWGSIAVPRSVGGDFLLALHPGGTLAVEVVGLPPGVALILRVRQSADTEDYQGVVFERSLTGDDPFALPAPADRSLTELESTAVGRYVVGVELGHRLRFPRTIAAREVEVVAGGRTEVSLDVSGYQPPALVPISGTLTLPTAWGLDSFGIYFELLGEPALDGSAQHYLDGRQMQPLDQDRSTFAFRFDRGQAGRWELRFNPYGTTIAVDVPPGGLDGVRLVVSEPASVSVRVVDAESGEPVSDVRVSWMTDREAFETGGVLNGAGERDGGVFAFRAPAGPVEVWCMSDRWAFRRERFEALAGPNELRIELELACGIVLKVRDGSTWLRVADFAAEIRSPGDDSRGWLTGEGDSGLARRYTVPEPGRYLIQLAAPPGYRPATPIEVVVPAREFVEQVVDVERT